MKFWNYLILLAAWLGCAGCVMAAANDRQWEVDGIKRTGILCIPDSTAQQPAAGWPAVFVFHGHGGSVQNIRRQFQTDQLWPDAVVVYLQGLPTAGTLTDKDGKLPGWDSADPPDKNRDIHFYDLVLKDLLDHQHINPRRVFSTGHSNGGGFTFTLWAYRGDTLAAIAASSSIANAKEWPLLKPKPAMISSGRNDPIVKFDWQSRMMDQLKTLNGVTTDGKPWGTDGTWYSSNNGTPLVTIIHDGGHPPPAMLGQDMVDFFKLVSALDAGK